MIILLLWIVKACEVITNNLQIYPTENETYILPLQSLFTGQNLSYVCKDCPESVSIYNPMNKLYEQDIQSKYYKDLDQITINMNSNRTHFVILTEKKRFKLYKFTNSITMIRLCSIQIRENLDCLNAFFNQLGQILLDCYDSDNNLTFLTFTGKSLITYQQFNNSFKPLRTKPLSLFAQNKIYLLYGQFFQDYEVLTIFTQNKLEMINITTWQKRFIDFATSTRGFIYILSLEIGIFQTRMNLSNSLDILYTYPKKDSFLKIAVGGNYNLNSQCDNIVVATSNPKSYLLSFMAWDQMIVYLGTYIFTDMNFDSSTVIQIHLSEFFLVVQQNNSFTISSAVSLIYESEEDSDRHLVVFHRQKDPNQIYSYLDISNNYLFEFSDKIKIYSLKNPQLFGKFTRTQTNSFKITASDKYFPYLNKLCEITVNFFLLTQDDKNIYLLYNKTKQPSIIMQGSIFNYALTTFSGPLLNVTGILQNPALGSFRDMTFQELLVNFDHFFTITKLFYIKNLGVIRLFFVGANDDSIFFYFCKLNYECVQIYQDLYIYHVSQIEITYCYQFNLIVAINQGLGQIQIYFVEFSNYESQGEVSVKSHMLNCEEYIQFLLNYNNILVLQKNNEILIQSLNLIDYSILDGKKAKNLFSDFDQGDFDFTPKEIELNEQNQASSVFINLGESVLIMVIQNTQEIIPLDIIHFDFTIEKLNIINNQLIVSYFCSDLICLQVWKVYETLTPYFMQSLPSLKMKNKWQIQSDNLFLYILGEQDTMYVLSTTLTYHSALYYQFPFKGNYISSAYLGKHSLISYCNQLFSLSAQIVQQFTANPIQNNNYISQTFYHFSVTNPYNTKDRQTQNDILNIFNPMIQITFNQDTYTVNYTQKGNFIVNITELLVSSGQILRYKINDTQKTGCNITNYITSSSSVRTSYTILTILNSELIQQNNISMMLGSSGNKPYQYQFPFEVCQISSIYIQTLFSICKNLTQQYLTIFQLKDWINQSSIIQTTYNLSVYFEKTKKLMVVNNLIQILLANEDFSYYQIYVLNMIANETNITEITCDYGIQDFTFLSEPDSNFYILFFICQNSLIYKTGQIIDNVLTFEKLKHDILTIEKSYVLRSTQLIQVEVLYVKFHEILLLLTTSNMTSFVITTSYSKYNDTYFDLDLQEIIQTIPPYGNYNMTYNTMVSKGLIFCVFNSETERVFAIYNYEKMSKSYSDPLIMQGGINQSLPLPQSIVWDITSFYEGGTLYEITNGYLNQYSISNSAYLTCYLQQKKKTDDCTLIGLNSFSDNSIILQFKFVSYETNWFVGLIIFVLIIFGIQIIVYWHNAQDSEEQNEDQYEELELAL